eukprot:scaffold137101_cov15-Prasinocladus_malaysianus.AAC.3
MASITYGRSEANVVKHLSARHGATLKSNCVIVLSNIGVVKSREKLMISGIEACRLVVFYTSSWCNIEVE